MIKASQGYIADCKDPETGHHRVYDVEAWNDEGEAMVPNDLGTLVPVSSLPGLRFVEKDPTVTVTVPVTGLEYRQTNCEDEWKPVVAARFTHHPDNGAEETVLFVLTEDGHVNDYPFSYSGPVKGAVRRAAQTTYTIADN